MQTFKGMFWYISLGLGHGTMLPVVLSIAPLTTGVWCATHASSALVVRKS
jgi:hypothetical protein